MLSFEKLIINVVIRKFVKMCQLKGGKCLQFYGKNFYNYLLRKKMSLHYSMLSSRTSCGMEISISLLSSMIATDSMCAQIGKYNFFWHLWIDFFFILNKTPYALKKYCSHQFSNWYNIFFFQDRIEFANHFSREE